MEIVRPFTMLGRGDAALAGGKGASLGEMTQAGIPVPSGFVVLAGAFERFIEETDLNVEIRAILDTVNTQEMHTVEHASEKIQHLIHGAHMPDDIAAEVLSEYKKLDAQYVAVRSSATAEDGATAAWAGQLDSYLNTIETDVLTNVQRCWASLFTPRAIFYRFEKDLHLTKISVAVVIQKMIQSETSGIAFSVHPVTEDYNQLIIEAGYGLGEAVVSGQITPDSYVVEKEPREIIDKNISTQTRGLARGTHGGNEWYAIAEPQASAQVLTDTQINELAALVVRIEAHYGFPCDIEWASEGGAFYITQSRPITTLSDGGGGLNTAVDSVLDRPYGVVKMRKEYTRDTTLIIQQAWAVTLENHRSELGLDQYNDRVLALHYLRDGVTEIWENTQWTPDLMDAMLRINQERPEVFQAHITSHREHLAQMQPYWDSGFTNDPHTLAHVVDEIFDHMFDFDWMYYPSLDERTPAAIRAAASELRDKDAYFDNASRYIRASLVAIYPEIAGFEQGVLRSEILHCPPVEELQRRYQHFVIVGERVSFEGTVQDFQKTQKHLEFLFDAIPEGVWELHGQTGSTGVARGPVRIMKRKDQVREAQTGDVIVSAMTTPDFIPAMQKAVAIVTDEGGIMCHAAIVAREMKKPCLIGTKFATEVFKDGDVVEVDAERGIVRKVDASTS